MKNNKQLKIGKELQSQLTGVCKLHRASYDAKRCYAIVHQSSGFVTIFEDAYVYKKLIDRLKSGWILIFDNYATLLRFRLRKKNVSIDLSQFVMAKYSGCKDDSCYGLNVSIVADNRKTDNFLDLRRCNVYLSRERFDYKIEDRPGHTGEKYIRITFLDGKENQPCYVSYTPELDTILRNHKHCDLYKYGGRYRVSFNRCYPVDIGKFIAIYKYYFERYDGRADAVEAFINDFEEIKNEDGRSVEHLNGNDLHNTFDNLLLVPLNLNRKKGSLIKWFAGEYGVFTAVNERNEILIAYRHINPITHEPQETFCKCLDYESFVEWILFHLGLKVTGKLQVVYNPMIEGKQEAILTPCGMKKAKQTTREKVSGNTIDFWEYLNARDYLLSLPDDAFTVWKKDVRIRCPINEDGFGSIGDIEEMLPFIQEILPGIHGEAFIKITPMNAGKVQEECENGG